MDMSQPVVMQFLSCNLDPQIETYFYVVKLGFTGILFLL